MIILEIEGKQIELPSDLSEFKLSTYIPYLKALGKYRRAKEAEDPLAFDLALQAIKEVVPESALNDEDYSAASKMVVINTIIQMLDGVIVSFIPPNITEHGYKFVYKDKEYHVPFVFFGDYVSPKMKYSLFLEAMQTLSDCSYDDDGTIEFTSLCRIMAIFASEETNDETPFKLRHKIDEKTIYFEDIDTRTALEVDFFLGNLFKI